MEIACVCSRKNLVKIRGFCFVFDDYNVVIWCILNVVVSWLILTPKIEDLAFNSGFFLEVRSRPYFASIFHVLKYLTLAFINKPELLCYLDFLKK